MYWMNLVYVLLKITKHYININHDYRFPILLENVF